MRSAVRTTLIVALVLALVAAVALLVAWSRAGLAPSALEARLVAGHTIQRQALEQGRDALAATALQIAEDRAFAAYIAASLGREVVDTVSIRDLLNERSTELGLEGGAVISAGGTVVVGIGALRTLSGRVDGQPGVAAALTQARPASGFWRHEGLAMQVALVPIRQGPLLEALLVLARPIDRDQVAELARDSALDLHLMLDSQTGTLLASSDPQVGAGVIRAAAGTGGTSGATVPPGRGGSLASFDASTWLHSTVPRRELEAQQRSKSRLLLAAEVAAVIALLLAGALALSRGGGAAGAAGGNLAGQRRPESASQDQRRSRELDSWLARQATAGRAPPAEQAATPAPGILLGERYQLLTTQDESVGASVHRALDRQQDKVVTLFCLKAGAPRDTARNFRIGAECRRAMRVVHPNLARIVDVSQDRAMVMIAVEAVSGQSLQQLLERQGPPPLQAGLLVAKRVVSALRELHEAGALIRRLDPEQVLFESDGRIRLLPVTAATVADAIAEGAADSAAGTDQATGRRADMQALGGLLRLVFTGGNGELSPNLPPDLRALIARCLQAGDGPGYASAEAVLADLDRI